MLAGRGDVRPKALARSIDAGLLPRTAGGRRQCHAGGRRAGRSGSADFKALRALQDADVVFHDELVSPAVLDRTRRDATRVPSVAVSASPASVRTRSTLLVEAASVRRTRGAPQGRRSVRVRARRRGGRGAARGRHPCGIVPGHHRGPGLRGDWRVPLTFRSEALRLTSSPRTAPTKRRVDWRALRARDRRSSSIWALMARFGARRAGGGRASGERRSAVVAHGTRPDSQRGGGTTGESAALAACAGDARRCWSSSARSPIQDRGAKRWNSPMAGGR